jgi:arylsulfatase A-like enzyme
VPKRIVAAIAGAAAEAVLAAAAVGALEGARLLAEVGAPAGAVAALGAWAVIAGVACAGAAAAALAFAAVLAALGRVPALAAWGRDVVAGGAPRAIAVWRAALAAAAVLAVGAAVFAIVGWSHDAFRFTGAGPVGLIVTCIVTPVAAAAAAAALALDRRAVARIRAGGRAAAALDGRRIWIAGALAVAALAVVPPLVTYLAAPEIPLERITGTAQLAAALAALRALRVGRRRAARLGALAALAACAAGLWQLARVEPARGAVVVYGVFGRAAARTLWRLADRDGDGYPPAALGGADCDDADPARHPGAREIAGNGVDENCTGADAPRAALAARAAPRPPAEPPAGPAPRPNVVVITIDALRADHLGAYGYGRPVSPAIDAFAAQATRFAWALTPFPATRYAIPALHTGRMPALVDAETPTLASVLGGAGWDTAAITCCDRFARGERDVAGFATVDSSPDSARVRRAGQSNADVVADAALHWLAHREPAARPFLLWLHFYDPHHPYRAPEDATRFGGHDRDRYDAEIAFADRHVGRVLAALDPRTTIVAIAADHGDEFEEHGTRFHARSLYNQVVRIPLLVRHPGAPARVITGPVSLADVTPTLLELAGVAGPPGMNGRSLAASIRTGAEPPAAPVLMELVPDGIIWRNVAAVAYGGWKVIWDRDANAWSLFSLEADPDDRRDRAAAEPAVLADLRRRLLDALDRELAAPPP